MIYIWYFVDDYDIFSDVDSDIFEILKVSIISVRFI